MSSNIKTKNLIYKLNKYDELPYQSSQMINYDGVNNSYVNMVQLNNTYGQCVDNDMFIAKSLLSRIDKNAFPGPKVITDENEIASLPDGAKFFTSNGDSSIMQKKVRSFQQSLTKCQNSSFNDIQFIHNIGMQSAIVCTTFKTYIVSIDKITDFGTFQPKTVVKDITGRDFIVTAVLNHGKYSKLVFAGHPSGKMNGLYMLDTTSSSMNEWFFTPINSFEIADEICTMSAVDDLNYIAFATKSTLYRGQINSKSVHNVKPIGTFGASSGTGFISAILVRSSKIIVFTDTGLIYNVSYSASYDGFYNASLKQLSDNDGITAYDMHIVNGIQYFATSSGLCVLRNGSLEIVDENYTSPVKHLEFSNDGTLWFGDESGRILYASGPNDVNEYANVNAAISDIRIINGVKILATSNGMMYEQSHAYFISLTPFNNMHSAKIINGFSSNGMYIAGMNSNELAVVNANLTVTNSSLDFNFIEGLSQISQLSKAGYSPSILTLARFNNSDYAFVNFKSNSGSSRYSVLFNATLKSEDTSYSGAGQSFTGVVSISDNEMYVFTSKNVLHYYIDSGSVHREVITTPDELDDNTVIDYAIDERRCVMSLASNDGSCTLANVIFNADDEEINVIDTISVETSCNVVKWLNNDYVALGKSSNTAFLSAFDLKHQMKDYSFEDTNSEFQELQDIYSSNDFQIVNNLSYRIKDTLLYRRADYIVPVDGDISAVKSFLNIESPGDDNNVELKCFSIEQLANTASVSGIDSAYDSNSYTGTCYISSGNAVYTFQPNSSTSKIFNPTSPFTATASEKAVNENVVQSIVSKVEFIDNYNASQILTSYTGTISAYEICSDSTLHFVKPQTESTIGSGGWTTSTQVAESSSIDCSGLTPKMMCKSGSDVYVLLFNGSNQYTVKKIVASSGGYSLVDVIGGIASAQSLKSFVFEHDDDFGDMLNYLDGQTIDGELPADDDVFESYANNFQLSDYDVDHQTSSDISDGYIHIVFDSSECVIHISSSTSKSVIEWIDKHVNCTISFNQTKSNVENALFTYNMCAQNVEMPLLFKLSGSSSALSFLSKELLLHGKNAPAAFNDSKCIEYDKQLHCTMIVKDGNATIYDSSFTAVSPQISIPLDASNIHLMQCCNKSFSNNKYVTYTTYNSSLDRYQMYVKNDSTTTLVYSSPTSFVLDVLNSNAKYPLISYGSSIATLKYESTHNVAVSVVSTRTLGIVGLRAFAIDSDNPQYTYIAAGNSIFHASMNNNSLPSSTALTYSTVKDVVFPSNMFGHDLYGYANTTDAKSVAFSLTNAGINVTELNESSELETSIALASVGLLVYDRNVYSMYCARESMSFEVDFSKFDKVNLIEKNSMSISSGEKVKDIIQLDDLNSYALQAQHYIYRFNDRGGVERIDQMRHAINMIGFLKEYENKNSYVYFSSQGDSVISSDDLRSWQRVAYIGSNGQIDDFELMNSYVSLISKNQSSDAGLYYTYYSYFLENNSQAFTAESAYYAYYDNIDEIGLMNAKHLAEHVYNDHLNPASDMALVNSYMDISFELSGFMKMDIQNDVQNDYIDQIITGDENDDNILVFASNTAVNSKWNQLKCNYIAKCWKSGLTELYIYIPTTNTHYIPHIQGASQCYGYDQKVKVNGRNLVSNIRDNFTSIRINVVSSYFTVDTLMENTIKPNSLPLRIFKDADAVDEAAGSMFHSFVCPSVARDFSQDDTMLGYYAFNYYCFGSDAQAVKLTFFNESPNYGRKYKTIEYNANGGTMNAFPGMKTIKQRIYEGDDPVPMYWQVFDKAGSFFTGWSQSQVATEGSQAYASGTMISYETLNSMRLTLYACWISYKFGVNDTVITISNNEPTDYTIAEIAIDPNASIPDNPSLGNKLIVDYGD